MHMFGKPFSFCGATVAMLSDSQAHELHTKHSAEAMKAEKWEFEYKNLHDKYDALLKEKEVSWYQTYYGNLESLCTVPFHHFEAAVFVALFDNTRAKSYY